MTGDISDLLESELASVKLVGQAINTKTRLTLELTNSDLEEFGGAVTNALAGDRRHPDTIAIQINPAMIASTIVPGELLSGTSAGTRVGLPVSLGTAVIHELGHASGYFLFNLPRRGSNTNADALMYENLHRALAAKASPLASPAAKRTSH